MPRHPRRNTERALVALTADAQQRRAALTRAVHQVSWQLGVRQDTVTVWLNFLTGLTGGGNRPGGLPLLGLLYHTCGLPLGPARDSHGQPAYLCRCASTPVISAHVAHLHVLTAIGRQAPRLLARHGLTGLPDALTAIRVNDNGTVCALRWLQQLPAPAGEWSPEGHPFASQEPKQR